MLKNLNDRQLEAVTNTQGPMLVLAGAGSGKTRVLTTRIAHLIKDKEVDSRSILAITFTNKAAGEMKERVAELLAKDVSSMWIGTFHSIGSKMLRRGAEKIGYRPNFTIYDRDDQKTLLKEIYKEMDMDDKVLKFNTALSLISKAKNEGVAPASYWESYGNDALSLTLARVYQAYEDKKIDYNAMDFDDLITKAIELLQKDTETRAYYQNRFEYIFVDEYQDTNGAQYEMVRILSEKFKNICVVGDNDQSIYGWRGADISNILNFENDFKNARVVLLEENYRSTQNILNAANEVIANNPNRKDKNLWTSRGQGQVPSFREFPSENNEARGLVDQMKALRDQGHAYSSMAVLYRTNAQSRVLEEELINGAIPYRVIGGLKFYDRKEIKDIMAYLRLIVNPRDDIAFRRIINEPKRGIGSVSLEKFEKAARADNFSPGQYISLPHSSNKLGSKAKEGLEKFRSIIEKSQEALEAKDLFFAVKDIIDLTGIKESLEAEKTIEAKSRLENIDSYLSSIASFIETNPGSSLEDYLAQVSLYSDVDKTEEASGVSLMTIHSAKGLEYPIVFVSGLEEGLFPSKYSIDEGNIEEERRLFYVALTRAEDLLYLSSAQSRRVFGQIMASKKSRFVEELKDTIEWKEEEKHSFMEGSKLSTNPRDKSQNWDLDYMKYGIKERKESLDKAQADSLKLGDKVKHKKFGEGTIITIEDNEVLISFEKVGLKKLRSDIAPLEKI